MHAIPHFRAFGGANIPKDADANGDRANEEEDPVFVQRAADGQQDERGPRQRVAHFVQHGKQARQNKNE